MRLHSFRRTSRHITILVALIAAMVLLVAFTSGCMSDRIDRGGPTATLTVTPTYPPTATSTPAPLGFPDNPFVIGLVSEQADEQIDAAAGELARQIGSVSGATVRGLVYRSYAALLEGFEDGQVHAAWLPPLTYLHASRTGLAEVAILTNHFGVYQYGTQFLANVESGFTPYFDPISGYNAAGAQEALEQFRDLRPCWVDTQSPSGYIVPAGLLKTNEITAMPAVIAQNHTAVVRALYIKGVCDYGATFAISGDPRTALAVEDLPDVMNRVLIIWRSEAVIPNYNLSLLTGMTEADRQFLTKAFLDLGSTPEGRALMSLSAGYYQIEEIRPVSDDVYDPLRDMVRVLDLDLREMIGK